MAWSSPHSPQTRAAVEAELREAGVPVTEIAARNGIPYRTVIGWKNSAARRRKKLGPAIWPARRRAALERLYETPGVDPGDLAVLAGQARATAASLFRDLGFRRRRMPVGPEPGAPSVADLDTRLRAHVARQIAAFDARLGTDDGAVDSGRVLRDLGGLKRLIDDMRQGPGAARGKPGGDADADPARYAKDPAQDLAERRARLARHLAAFTAGELAERLSRDPVAGRDRDAGA